MLTLARELCTAFFKIGLFTLGGGLAIVSLVQQEMVARGWLTNAQFADILGIAQATPGAIGVNTATFVGWRLAEQNGGAWWAALALSACATCAVMAPSVVGVHFGGGWFERHRDSAWTKSVFAVLRPLVAGFVLAAGVSLALDCFGAADVRHLADLAPTASGAAVFAAAVVLTLTDRFSPLWGLLLGAVVGLVAGGCGWN